MKNLRGKTLERYFCSLADIVCSHNGHAHKNHALRNFKGVNLKNGGECWDFEFFGRKFIYCFDTKETTNKTIYLSSFLKAKSNSRQFNALRRISLINHSCSCGFAVWFMNFDDMPRFLDVSLIDFTLAMNKNNIKFDTLPFFPAADMISDCSDLSKPILPELVSFKPRFL